MDGRTSAWILTMAWSLACTGCITTQPNSVVPISTTITTINETPKPKKDDGPKRHPQPRTEIAFGKMKEAEAETDAAKQNPELQARLRDEARQAYQQALKLDPNNLDASRCLGRIYTKMSDYERALDVYKKEMVKHPKDASLWYDLGLCHQRRKDFPESVRCFHKALALDPENRDYLKKLGFTLAWMGQLDQGLMYLTRAQGSAQAHYNLARVLLKRDQHDLARHHLHLALRENSQLEAARELLARLDNPDPRAGVQ